MKSLGPTCSSAPALAALQMQGLRLLDPCCLFQLSPFGSPLCLRRGQAQSRLPWVSSTSSPEGWSSPQLALERWGHCRGALQWDAVSLGGIAGDRFFFG